MGELADREKEMINKQALLEKELQEANFEKNRFKEAIESHDRFENIREVVNKV